MSDFRQFLNDPRASALLRSEKKLEQLKDAPETQRLFTLLGQNAGGDLERAAEQAAGGDSAPLLSAIQKLMNDPEGKRLIETMQNRLK